MKSRRGSVVSRLAPMLLLLLAACGGADEVVPVTEADEEYRGLSREQIEAEATPMSPEEAERLGIIDTTIRLQPPMNPDSVVPLDTPIVQ